MKKRKVRCEAEKKKSRKKKKEKKKRRKKERVSVVSLGIRRFSMVLDMNLNRLGLSKTSLSQVRLLSHIIAVLLILIYVGLCAAFKFLVGQLYVIQKDIQEQRWW